MLGLVRTPCPEGAFGVSAGLSYVPNIYMSTDELAAIVAEAAAVGGIFANHARTMNGTDPEAIREAIAIGEQAGAPVHFFHLNSISSTEADTFLGIIDEARDRGLEVTGDSYTYTWGITGLSDYIPAWHRRAASKRCSNGCAIPRRASASPATSSPSRLTWRTSAGTASGSASTIRRSTGSWSKKWRRCGANPPRKPSWTWSWSRRAAASSSTGTTRRTLCGRCSAQPYVAGGTDGGTIDLDSENLPPLVHPRHLGTLPRLLGTYVREEGLLSWEEAIRKLSGLPAEILGLEERGTLVEGNFADLAIFDPETIRGVATFEDPFHYSIGMRYVLVNGTPVVDEGEYTRALPGRALRGPGFVPE